MFGLNRLLLLCLLICVLKFLVVSAFSAPIKVVKLTPFGLKSLPLLGLGSTATTTRKSRASTLKMSDTELNKLMIDGDLDFTLSKPNNPYAFVSKMTFTYASSWLLFTLWTYSVSAISMVGATGYYIGDISLFLLMSGASKNLQSAFDRDRLNGTTFKMLNIGILTSFVLFFIKILRFGSISGNMGRAIFQLPVLAYGAFISGLCLVANGTKMSLKAKLKGEKGTCPFRSVLYATALVFQSVLAFMKWQHPLSSPVSSIALGLIPAMLLALQQGSLVKDRLRSETYKDMNLPLLGYSLVSLLQKPQMVAAIAKKLPTAGASAFEMFFLGSHITTLGVTLMTILDQKETNKDTIGNGNGAVKAEVGITDITTVV